MARTFQQQLADENSELRLDDAAKIVGCWNGLAKRGTATLASSQTTAADAPRGCVRRHHQELQADRRASSARSSPTTPASTMPDDDRDDDATPPLIMRGRSTSTAPSTRWSATEARLAEGADRDRQLPDPDQRPLPVRGRRRARAGRGDVPHPAQVRRRHRPVRRPRHAQGAGQAVRLHHPADRHPVRADPRGGAERQQAYAVVWEVLQALRAHDERFDAMVNRIDLNRARTTGSRSSASAYPATEPTTDPARPRHDSHATSVPCRSQWLGRVAGRDLRQDRRQGRHPPLLGGLGQGRRRHRRAPHHPDQCAARRPDASA